MYMEGSVHIYIYIDIDRYTYVYLKRRGDNMAHVQDGSQGEWTHWRYRVKNDGIHYQVEPSSAQECFAAALVIGDRT